MSESMKTKSFSSGFTGIPKITIIGDSGVGKTSILNRLVNNEFKANDISTIGVSHFTKILDGCKFYIWDTAGQERFRSISKIYYEKARAIIVTFDYNDLTHDQITHWVSDIREFSDDVPIYLMGNKYGDFDIFNKKNLTDYDSEISKLFLVNARTGRGIERAFSHIIKDFPKINENQNINTIINFIEPVPKDCCNIS
jgi:small GTP-binding protein